MTNSLHGVLQPGLAHALSARSSEPGRLAIVLCPFIKLDALRWMLERSLHAPECAFVSRWRGGDLAAGVSDVEVYQLLKEHGLPMYAHRNLHVKLFLFSRGASVLSTGNLTLSGLGLSSTPNIEGTVEIELSSADWHQIYQVLNESVRIDDALYTRACAYVNAHRKEKETAELDLPSADDRHFSILSLPASKNPEALLHYYITGEAPAGEDSVASLQHDLALYGIPPGLPPAEFWKLLSANFRAHPFIDAFTAWLRTQGPARFGAVKEWIQQNCSDKPVPYCWELTKNTQILYTWLTTFFEEVSWEVPGRQSQVISWRRT